MTITELGAAQAPKAMNDAEIERRAEALLEQLTLDEKISLLGGVNGFDVPGLPRLGIPQLGTADSPFGVRADGPATVYAGGINLAATWNPALAERVGTEIGRDARARGKHYSLGPGVNIYRSSLNGRNFEYYGEDPFLGARIAVAFIRGIQSQGVSATIKHYLGNNSEFWRNTSDSRIDERTLREIYLPIFEAAVKEADVGAIMSAYNLTNGAYMSANRRLNVDVAKSEWGFRGVMMSDWGATHDTLGAANGGTDLEMPGPRHFNPDSLLPLIRQGKITQATIDDKVRRLMRNHVRFGWMDRPQLDPSIPRLNQAGREAALQAAREGMVLLKNERNVLPLDCRRVRTLAVIGPNAHPAVPVGGGSAAIPPWHAVSFLEGLSNHLGAGATVLHARGIPSLGRVASTTSFSTAAIGGRPGLSVEVFETHEMSGAPKSTRIEPRVMLGAPLDLAALATADVVDFSIFAAPPRALATRWTGYLTPQRSGSHDFIVQQGGFADAGYRLYIDDELVADSWKLTKSIVEVVTLALDAKPHKVVLEYRTTPNFGGPFIRMGVQRVEAWVDPSAVALAARADAVVLAVGFDASTEAEGWDRSFRLPPGQEELVRQVVAVNRNAIVVLTSGGGVDMSEWMGEVPAVLQAWYPGDQGGVALAEILFGDVNPSGHLPATFEAGKDENPAYENYYPVAGTNRIEYKESIFVGYRGYEHNGINPLFPFGHGLSYTTFRYESLAVGESPASRAADPRYDVTFDITNTGPRAGAAVAQVYVADRQASVPRPPKELKGFAKVELRPGETRRVTVPLDLRSFAYYDVAASEWRAEAGEFDVLIGSSSADIALRGTMTLGQTVTGK